MTIVAPFVVPATLILLTVAALKYLHSRGKLTARRFGLVFAIGLALSVLGLYYSSLGLSGALNPRLAVLGLAIGVLNLVLGYLIAFLMFRYLGRRFL